jgi:hypothetical protein
MRKAASQFERVTSDPILAPLPCRAYLPQLLHSGAGFFNEIRQNPPSMPVPSRPKASLIAPTPRAALLLGVFSDWGRRIRVLAVIDDFTRQAQGETELLIGEELVLEFAFGRYSRSRHRGSARSIKCPFGFV